MTANVGTRDRARRELEQLLYFAVEQGVSDVHLKAGRPPLLRKDGSLVPPKGAGALPGDTLEAWLSAMASDGVREHLAQHLEADFAFTLPDAGRFRVNAFHQREELGMVLRHIPSNIPTLEDLAMPRVLSKIALAQRGLVLVTGPSGSGKSTTLAAMIDYLAARRPCHVLTVEDPMEFLFRDRRAIVNQREVGRDTRSFGAALRAALRQDPDVILLGELRDAETIETALHAAETGRLVLSTLHTMDTMETINRILGVFPPHQQPQIRLQLSTLLTAVVGQRLVRAKGGGRRAACEILRHTERVRELIADPERTHELPEALEQGRDVYGMQSFDQSLLRLWRDGAVDQREALAAATNPSELQMRFEGIDEGGL